MSLLVFISHIVGVVVATWIVFCAQTVAIIWHFTRVDERNKAEITWKLGVSQREWEDNVETGVFDGKTRGFLSEKYSNELLSNRVSDFCGVLLKVCSNCVNVIEIIVFLVVLWQSISGKRDEIVMLWVVPVLAVVWWVVAVVFQLTCSVLTGRFPGEAKARREQLMKCG